MISRLHSFFSTLSCRRYTELASLSFEQPLTFRQKIGFWSHHAMCVVCRRYRRQLILIERLAEKLAREPAELSTEKLSDDTKRKVLERAEQIAKE